jgi:ABC-type sugar transport system permease subunit
VTATSSPIEPAITSPRRAPVWLALPMGFYLLLLLGFPTLFAVKLALTDPLTGSFPSLSSAYALWDDRLFRQALVNNVAFPVVSVTVELVAGLALALLLSTRIPGRRWLRAVVILPFALPEVVFLTIMRYMFAPRGYANAALLAAGLGPVDWLLPGHLITFLTVVAADAWHVTPVVFLMLLAGLTAIPTEVGEAARLDGARGWRHLLFITLPLLRPAIIAAVLLRGLDALRVFASPLLLAGVEGMPVLSTYAYHQWADYGNDASAAAAAVLLALVSVVLTVPLLRWRAEK